MTRSIRTLAAFALLALLARCSGCGGEEPCPSGQTSCIDGCVDLQTNVRNCGTCGLRCPTGASCTAGACQCPAAQPEVCSGACVDPATYATDPLNCGACGIACGLGTCSGGSCACNPGATPCDLQSPRCVDLTSNAQNCGACGAACPLTNEKCVTGVCQCGAGDTACPVASPTACVDLATDAANCGGCGRSCPSGATCSSSACVCPTGTTACPTSAPTSCVSLAADDANCGSCGFACASGTSCTSGICCSADHPVACGATGLGGGTCCAGSGCCSGNCQTQHTNGPASAGLGQHYYDCDPPGTYDVAHAQAAAKAWDASGIPYQGLLCASQSCLGWQTARACGTWCYGADALRGQAVLVQNLACQCPPGLGTPNWD